MCSRCCTLGILLSCHPDQGRMQKTKCHETCDAIVGVGNSREIQEASQSSKSAIMSALSRLLITNT